MLSNPSTPHRPQPPSKARFVFPSSSQSADTHEPEYDHEGDSSIAFPSSDNLDWLNDKSRDELSELLISADSLIRERENELGYTTAVVKSLYQDNIALKDQHKALLERIPPSPASLSPAPSRLTSPLSGSETPHYYSDTVPSQSYRYASRQRSPYFHHTRKVSVSQADLSLLSDQNVELCEKLERLEAESTQADQKGRRLLKRLETEILVLREELDKTRAKSDELEARARQSEEARMERAERHEQIKALRPHPVVSMPVTEEDRKRDFSPANPLVPTPCAEQPGEEQSPEDALFTQLMQKIRELEETNSRIVQQQFETVVKLQAVQRETATMNRMYECLNDSSQVQLELVSEDAPTGDESVGRLSSPSSHSDGTVRFRSFRRTLEGQQTSPLQHGRTRKSVMGLFDAGPPEESRGSHSSSASLLSPNSALQSPADAPSSPALSALSFSSSNPSASPSLMRGHKSLGSELGSEFFEQNEPAMNAHLRTTSLLSLNFSSTSSSPRESAPLDSVEGESTTITTEEDESSVSTPLTFTGGLQLTLEPPTPQKDRNVSSVASVVDSDGTEVPGAIAFNKLHRQRIRTMSQTVRTRTRRWVDARYSSLSRSGTDQLAASLLTPDSTDDSSQLNASSSPTPTISSSASTRSKPESHTSRKPVGKFRMPRTDGGLFSSRFSAPQFSTPRLLSPPLLRRHISEALDSISDRVVFVKDVFQSPSTTVREVAEASTDSTESSPRRSPTARSSSSTKRHEGATRAHTPTSVSLNADHVTIKPTATATNRASATKEQTLVSFVLTIWVWIQFFIIIAVFVWAMAKRGPRAVFNQAEHKRRSGQL
ncbi:hypothetical protein FISHEDRAFT_58123 [Fistulina hepatica ATCC 64428]|nr:hypothetical protein FISHEDRAFT_58123 [Fistulina hepatica ATCC 64428]